ncbi:hypothetical protein AgCh_040071 [Apium graveolens]
MEGEKVMESLDCLWFFSNVMHAPKTQVHEVHSTKEDEDIKVENDEVVKMKMASEPIKILETKRVVGLVEVIKCGKNVGLRLRDEKENGEERKVRKATRKRSKKILQETGSFPTEIKDVNVGDYEKELGFDFRFDLSEICMMIEGYERFNGRKCGKMMPPLSDGMAMKKHLKSWAYAVACNVK